jgi:hypothetical protein
MAGRDYTEFFGPSYRLNDEHAGIESAINCFPQKLQGERWLMRSIEGTVDVQTIVEIRGSIVVANRWFVVAGANLYEMSSDGTSRTLRGELLTTTGYVSMDDNTTQLAIVDGGSLYILSLGTNNFQRIISTGWLGSDHVTELDGYFVFAQPGTEQWYLSEIDDGTLLNGLDFSSADALPDKIIAHTALHRQLWFMGELSTEIWVNSGTAAFPFVRYNSYTVDVGVVGKNAWIKAADTLFFIGKTDRGTGIVYMIVGNQPRRISNLAIEEQLRESTDLSEATFWTYQTQGHEFIGINAPGLETTLVFDAAVEMWSERGEWEDHWIPLRWSFVTAVGNQHFASDSTGIISRLDEELNQLSGRHLVRERAWPHMIAPSLEATRFFGVELMMLTGAGGNVTLEVSNDGGKTFGPPLLRDLGTIGRWMQRIRWLHLGASFNRVFRVRVSDNVPFSIHGAAVET